MRGIVGVLLVAVALVGCADEERYAPLTLPEGFEEVTTTTSTVPIDYEQVQLPPVPGSTTTTVAIRPGPVTIVGRVDGPDGPVGGAIVRLERIVGRSVARLDVPTAADGSWNASGVIGGRYRVRAWLAPSLGMSRAQVVFVEAARPRPMVLRLERVDGVDAAATIAPSPPVVGAPANLVVRVSTRAVDSQGVARATPVAGLEVALSGTGSWSLIGKAPPATTEDGTVTYGVTCRAVGDQPLIIILDTGERLPLDVPECVAAGAA